MVQNAVRNVETAGHWQRDFLASVVVFLVALPLCMGIAIASGAPVSAGLITGIVAGIVVGSLSGCPLQVSGPAAGLTVIVYDCIQKYGLESLGLIVLIAGLLQLLAGSLKLGQWFRAVSPAVVKGMLAGIGVLIVASQFHVMVDDVPRGGGLANLLAIPAAVIAAFEHSSVAAAIGVLTISVLMLWKRIQKSFPRTAALPASLMAVITATSLAALWQLPVIYVNVPEAMGEEIRLPNWSLLTAAPWGGLFQAGVLMAVVASAETLLSATAVDQMHDGPRTKYDRELIAQGAGNTLCGLLGALPITGVIVRSTANVQSGAKTRWSAILHGMWLLVFAVALSGVLRLIPTASLAAILVFTGYKLIDLQSIRDLRRYGWGEVGIYAATVLAIVVTDLLTGVLVGIGLAAAKLLYTFSHLETDLEVNGAEPTARQPKALLKLRGAATFVRLPQLAGRLEEVPRGAELHVDFEHLDYIDHACLDLLMTWAKQHETTGGSLTIDWESLHAMIRRESPLPPRHRLRVG